MNRIPVLLLASVLAAGFAVAQDAPIQAAKAKVSDEVRKFEEHVVTLANPFFQGRVPGTRGMEIAREYMEFWFKEYGLQPAFADESGNARKSWLQGFPLGGKMKVMSESLTVGGAALDAGSDYVAMNIGGSGASSADLVFCGYGIGRGPDGYTSLPKDANLEGKIAVIFSHEPMDDGGQSKFATRPGRWSRHRLARFKARWLEGKKASAVIIINAPGAKGVDGSKLDRGTSSRPSRVIPVFHMTTEAGQKLVAGSGKSLMDLRRMADAGPCMVDLEARVHVAAEVKRDTMMAYNVGGLIPGAGALADQIVMVGAHLDHLGMGNFGSRDRQNAGKKLHPGADDNATGAAAVIMLAERLKKAYDAMPADAPRRTLVFVGWDAEESGLNGSAYYVNNPIAPIEKHALLINFDMIGRVTNKRLRLAGVTSGTGMEEWLTPIIEECPLTLLTQGRGSGGSDHMSFMRKRVPYLFSINDLHGDYHTPRDTSWKINCVDGVKVIDLYEKIMNKAAVIKEQPRWRSSR